VARRLVEREKLNVVALDTLAEIVSTGGECDDRVAEAVCRHPVDEIDHAVLQPAHVEAEEQVHDQGA